MDTQDSLIIEHEFLNKKEVVDLNHLFNNRSIFTFGEYETIKVSTNSSKYSIALECDLYLEDDSDEIHETTNNMLYLEKDKVYTIALNDDSRKVELSYLPDRYQITIESNEKNYSCYFRVLYNNNLKKEGAYKIIDLIENFVSGLSIDFFSDNPISGISGNKYSTNLQIYQILAQEEVDLLYVLKNILSSESLHIQSKIVEEHIEKKQNLKTIRKNLLSVRNDKVYNVKKVANFNTTENIIIKRYLMRIASIIKSCDVDLNSLRDEKQNSYDELSRKCDNISKFIKSCNSSLDLKMAKGSLIAANAERTDALNWINKIDSWNLAKTHVLANINHVLNITEFSQVDVNNNVLFSQNLYANRNFMYLKRLYDSISTNGIGEKEGIFTTKKTYLLFEIYGFILIENILKELGFKCDTTNLVATDFSSDTKFIFRRNEYLVEVIYDHSTEKAYFSTNDTICSLNSFHNKPDYLIKFYKDDELVDVKILEVKYRSLANLAYNEDKSEKLDETIDDYYQLVYKDKDGKIRRGIVSNVMILYPSKDEMHFYRHGISEFIGINVIKDFNESLGYNGLKEEFTSVLGTSSLRLEESDIDRLYESLIL